MSRADDRFPPPTLPKRKSHSQPDQLASQFLDALTETEITQLLDVLFQVLPDKLQTRAIAQLDSNTIFGKRSRRRD